MFGLSKKKKNKLFVLGIDGVPYTLIKEFSDKGLMPNLDTLRSKGTLMSMDASIPDVSSVSWTTFMTGVNPGRHGIYGFMDLNPRTYDMIFPNSSSIKSDTLWEIPGMSDKRSIVLNIPSTYPAKPLKGILTAGFVALDLKKATYPESAYEYLKSIDYRMDVNAAKAAESMDLLVEDIEVTFAKRREAILHFMKNEEWDLFIGTITESDRLHHFLWSAVEDSKHKFYDFFTGFYKQVDALIGEIISYCEDIPFMIVSDHGFTAIKEEVYINNWLKEKGYLNFKNDKPQSVGDIGKGSKAFAMDPARIYINRSKKYPLGVVDTDKAYEDLRLQLKDELLSFEIEGQSVVRDVYMKEEIYSGPFTEYAPDMVIIGRQGFDLKGAVNKPTLYGRGIFTGCHTQDNATFFLNRPLKKERINIVDVAGIMADSMGVSHKGFDSSL